MLWNFTKIFSAIPLQINKNLSEIENFEFPGHVLFREMYKCSSILLS